MPRKFVECPVCHGKGKIPIKELDEARVEEEVKKAMEKIRKEHGLILFPLPQNKIESV
jgi:hypothetical protein